MMSGGSNMEPEDILGMIVGMNAIEVPAIEISPDEIDEIDKFFEELSDFVPFVGDGSYDNIQRNIMLMTEALLSGKDVELALLKSVSDGIGGILEHIIDQIEQADMENIKKLLIEYKEEQEPTQRALAQKILEDIDLSHKAGSILKKWIQIKKGLLERSKRDMCEQCPERKTCEDCCI